MAPQLRLCDTDDVIRAIKYVIRAIKYIIRAIKK